MSDIQLIAFQVPGAPVPCARPRVVRRKGQKKPCTFMPASTVEYESRVERSAKQAVDNRDPAWPWPTDRVYRVDLHFHREAKRGDIDNFSKGALDGMRGVIFGDDSQVHELHAYMSVDRHEPRTAVTAVVIS